MSNNRYPVVFWAGTQAEYNAITTKSNNTIYFLLDINAMYRGSQRFGGDVTVAEARQIASAVVASGGFISSGGALVTQVGDYRLSLTGGGLAVSGSGASVVLSGGWIDALAQSGEPGLEKVTRVQITNDACASISTCDYGTFTSAGVEVSSGEIAASTGEGGRLTLDNNGNVGVYANGHNVNIEADGGGEVHISGTDVTVNSRPVATQLVTSTVSEMQPVVSVLSGGTSYIFDSDHLYSLEVASVVKTTEASYIHFTLDSVTAPTPVVISGVSYLNSATFEGGKEYLVGFFDGMAVVNEVTQ